jgi:hypothetical protein
VSEQWFEITKVAAQVFGGGAAGALINQWFNNRSKTREIYLVERVNRQPDEFRGTRYIRSQDGKERDVHVFRTYQMTLHNTSSQHLKNDEIQFEFSSEDVEPWASRPVRSKTALVLVSAVPTPPWKKAVRWQIPSLPPGDTVEFNFEVFEPSTEAYEAVLYPSANSNVVLKKIKGGPEPETRTPEFFRIASWIVVATSIVFAVVSLLDRRPSSLAEALNKATVALDESEKAPTDAERQVKVREAIRLLIKAVKERLTPPPTGPTG